MSEQIKRNFDIAIAFGIALCLIIVAMIGFQQKLRAPTPAYAAEATDTVIVFATVEPYISITVSPSQATMTPALIDSAGTTAVGSTSDITAQVSTNDEAGFVLSIQGANSGLLHTDTVTLIASVVSTSTLTDANDDDGYGVNATSTDTRLDIGSYYDFYGTLEVGGVTTSAVLSSTSSGPITDATTTMRAYAECESSQKSGVYSDTISLTATGGT